MPTWEACSDKIASAVKDERVVVTAYLKEQAEALRVPWLTDLILGLARDIEAGRHHR